MKPKVGIVIVNFNHAQETLAGLDAIRQLEYQNFTAAVVDNASEQKDREILSGGLSQLAKGKYLFVPSARNTGFAGGCNIGIKELLKKNPKYIWILNNDTLPEKHSLTNFVKCFEKMPQNIGIIGGKLLFPNSQKIQGIGGKYIPHKAKGLHIGAGELDNGQYDNPLLAKKFDYIIGASMFVKTKFIKDTGLMCEDYFLFFEEIDWSLRGKKRGWELGYCPDAIVYHKESASLKDPKNPSEITKMIYYYSMRNKLFFTKKYFARHLPIIYLRLFVQMLKEVKKGQAWRVKILSKLLLGKI